VSLFDGLTIPLSHWPGADPPPGFDTVKLKDASRLPDGVRIRIDFNAALDAEDFVRIAATLPRERIDFIEDPCSYDADVWRDLRARTGLRLAVDRGLACDAVDVLVHKPALQASWPSFDGEIVVTSYMDHPVGQLMAACLAASHEVSDRCGLMTHVLYEPDPFIDAIRTDGARLLPPPGTGIGFDDLLEHLSWKRLT
jgi:O-succinylbenzoate synthase